MMELRKYLKDDNSCPFDDWFKKLDGSLKAKVRARLKRAELTDNLGTIKQLGPIYEMKFTTGGALRVYFGKENNELILLLVGGNKSSQEKDIKNAKEYWEDYHA